MDKLLKESYQIVNSTIELYQPKKIIIMFSGGDDSLAAYNVMKKLKLPYDAVIHGYTGTGIRQTQDFVVNTVNRNSDYYIEANAGDAYERYVLRKGFFGVGNIAHEYSYHVLKSEHFNKVISKYFRQSRRNYPILFINGARRQESWKRMKTMMNPIRVNPNQKNNIWVNIINEWTKEDVRNFLEDENIERNPVSKELCRSGECMCGTMQTFGDRNEASALFPEWGRWLDKLEAKVMKEFPWRWGEEIKKSHLMEKNGQMNMFQPMCTGCKVNFPS